MAFLIVTAESAPLPQADITSFLNSASRFRMRPIAFKPIPVATAVARCRLKTLNGSTNSRPSP
jgi:hypothetical protein